MAIYHKNLKKIYDRVYKAGKDKFFTFGTDYVTKEVLASADFRNKEVLEVGCGTGETALGIAKKGGKVVAIDYSKEAIRIAKQKQHPNLEFRTCEYKDVRGKFDIIVMQEVLEHMDDPLANLRRIKRKLAPRGKIILTCPSFMNVRGYIWMTLLKLFNVPMSLSDVNFICPFDVEDWAKKLRMQLWWKTFNFDLGNNEKMLVDLRKRLPNALRDAGMKANIDLLLEWVEMVSKFNHTNRFSGAKGLYILQKI